MKRIFRSVFALLVVLTIAMTIPGTALAAGGTVGMKVFILTSKDILTLPTFY